MHSYHNIAVNVLPHLCPSHKVPVVFLTGIPQFRYVTLIQKDVPHVQQAEFSQERLRFGETTVHTILFLSDDEGSIG